MERPPASVCGQALGSASNTQGKRISTVVRRGGTPSFGGLVGLPAQQTTPAWTEFLETRLTARMQQIMQQADRSREVAFQDVKHRLLSFDAHQRRLDRSVAEVTGSCKGISDELQSHIRNVNQIDDRIMDVRRQLEEEMRTKGEALEDSLMRLSSATRVANSLKDETAKKVARMEAAFEERLARQEASTANVVELGARVLQLEERVSGQSAALALTVGSAKQHLVATESSCQDDDTDTTVASAHDLQQVRADVLHLAEESREVHSRLETQEERLKLLRSRGDALEVSQRRFTDRLEALLKHARNAEQLGVLDARCKAEEIFRKDCNPQTVDVNPEAEVAFRFLDKADRRSPRIGSRPRLTPPSRSGSKTASEGKRPRLFSGQQTPGSSPKGDNEGGRPKLCGTPRSSPKGDTEASLSSPQFFSLALEEEDEADESGSAYDADWTSLQLQRSPSGLLETAAGDVFEVRQCMRRVTELERRLVEALNFASETAELEAARREKAEVRLPSEFYTLIGALAKVAPKLQQLDDSIADGAAKYAELNAQTKALQAEMVPIKAKLAKNLAVFD